MYFEGIAIGLGSFLIIGLFHPIVIKAEYHFSVKIWPVFLLAGALFLTASIFFGHMVLSALLGVVGFTCLWSIKELYEQDARVKKGWFPQNPRREKSPVDHPIPPNTTPNEIKEASPWK